MGSTITMRVIDILGVALIFGLALRYGQEASGLIGSGQGAIQGIYSTAALYNAPAPPLRG